MTRLLKLNNEDKEPVPYVKKCTKKPLGWLGPMEKGVITLIRSKMKNKKVVVGYEYTITDGAVSVLKITLYYY